MKFGAKLVHGTMNNKPLTINFIAYCFIKSCSVYQNRLNDT